MSDFELPPTQKKSAVAAMTETPAAPEVKPENKEDDPKKYDPDELLRIFDEMIFAGAYSETITIRGKLKVGFSTRNAEQMDAITQKIDGMSAVLMATLIEKRSLLNLYHALISYQGTDLRSISYDDKVKFVNKLPAPVVGMLMVALFDFDNKINAATKEAESNF